MGTCFVCEDDMNAVDSCDPDRTITIAGQDHDPIPYGEGYTFTETDLEASGRCHDCGVTPGHPHHAGCDMEECPACGGQYFVCDCATPEKVRIWGPA